MREIFQVDNKKRKLGDQSQRPSFMCIEIKKNMIHYLMISPRIPEVLNKLGTGMSTTSPNMKPFFIF